MSTSPPPLEAVTTITSDPAPPAASIAIDVQQPPVTDPVLNPEQQAWLDRALRGESLILTGRAGTGKSHVAKYLCKELHAMNASFVFCASTGVAAGHIGGVTFHSLFSLGMDDKTVNECVRSALSPLSMGQEPVLRTINLVFVDEISMISADLFDKADQVARIVRNCDSRPFGGLQMLCSGDFGQLPPVFDKRDTVKRLVFDSKLWKEMYPLNRCVLLTQIFRQSDAAFLTMLEEVRIGRVGQATFKVIAQCTRPLPSTDGIKPTKLYALRREVEDENILELRRLPGESVIFTAIDNVSIVVLPDDPPAIKSRKEKRRKTLLERLKELQARASLELRMGAQVMLITNLDATGGLYNGARGIVMRLPSKENMSIGVKFVTGLLYDFGMMRFDIGDEFSNGYPVASRTQYPFILAWACTIHKSQGMTLDKVKVVLTGCFEKGQVYTALSRARTLEGLEVPIFNTQSVQADARVVAFWNRLEAGQANKRKANESDEKAGNESNKKAKLTINIQSV